MARGARAPRAGVVARGGRPRPGDRPPRYDVAVPEPNASLDAVRRYVDDNAERFVDELKALLRIRSVAGDAGEVARAAAALAEHFERVGLDTRILPSAGNPVVYGETLPPDATGPTVLLYGHYDVMPAGDADEWTSDPFEPVVRAGRIWCRGVGDNKAQHFAHVKALEAMRACGLPVPRLKFLVEGEEETGSTSLPGFVREHREMLAADLCYAADGPRHESNRPTVYLGCRGVLGLELSVRGANRDLHSGNRGGVAPNPAWRLVEVLASLRDADGKVTIEGFHDGIRPVSEAEHAHVASLPFDGAALAAELDLPCIADLDAAGYYRRLMFSPTLTINGLLGGYQGPGGKTVIPSRAAAKLDIRLVADQTPEAMVERLRAHLARHGFDDVTLELHEAMQPSRTPMDNPYVAPVVDAVRDASGEEPVVWPSLGGSIPQYAFVEGLGVPCIWSAYANWDEGNHAPDENMQLDLFLQAIRISASVFARLRDMERPAAPASPEHAA